LTVNSEQIGVELGSELGVPLGDTLGWELVVPLGIELGLSLGHILVFWPIDLTNKAIKHSRDRIHSSCRVDFPHSKPRVMLCGPASA
jgi:hypothetical protein